MHDDIRDIFISQLATPMIGERLFAQIPDIVFCIKNLEGRYISANRAFADRLGLKSQRDIIGKTATDLFPAYLAEIYQKQDAQVFESGQEITDQLELVNNVNASVGWYLASKFPLHNTHGNIIGLASISRDLQAVHSQDLEFAGLARTVEAIQQQFGSDIKPADLAERIKLSPAQLDRRMRKVFKLTTSQFIRKTRIEAAARLLTNSDRSIAEIAQECGYNDQSAFTRQFRQTVGMPPGSYRDTVK